ncbi:DNA annealing helicase and endonuclease ZRANB3 [Solanum pennellii]|uniref:DNA annealing helicase and endonuclease ZRANB3 n=1 Tax=Solanum pennellii TaxID=28526 RepID=A0ABM1GH99_SOLPN|nr:DNA annealing helicase and endonuclease ZRANB3 [Solanum pennellii]
MKNGEEEEEITEEQRNRAEANRLAALAKRKDRISEPNNNSWKLFKCRKLSGNVYFHKPQTPAPVVNPPPKPCTPSPPPQRFKARLEICSPDSFCVTPVPLQGFIYPGEKNCLEKLRDCLSCVSVLHCTQTTSGGKACVYQLRDYEAVLRSLKSSKSIECEEIPWGTFNVVERLSNSLAAGRWIPCRPEHLPDEKVDELISKLPKRLLDTLHPFQLEGVRFGLRRGGRCLIADEMGLGKTLQAITIASSFMDEGPMLIVCPAILRYPWAEELERWLPCLPSDIHLVFGHQDNPARLPKCPRVVVTSFTMLRRLRKSMLEQEWATLVVDESHNLHCTKKASENEEITTVLDVAAKAKHLILLSGTPSLSRPYDIFHQINIVWPGLLGKTKYDFAKTYCNVRLVHGCQGKVFQDFSKGVRLEELNVLLKQTVMIRRLKEHVLLQLPPLRRQIISLTLKKSDISQAVATIDLLKGRTSGNSGAKEAEGVTSDELCAKDVEKAFENLKFVAEDVQGESPERVDDDTSCSISLRELYDEALGIAKLPGFYEWLSIHPIITELGGEEMMEASHSCHKMIIFAHHHIVLDGVQEFLCQKAIDYIRIDANALHGDRQLAIQSFQSANEVKIALVGILSGGSGLNLTSAQHVVFLELPTKPAHMQQAECRAHRQGQTKGVNVYIFIAKDTSDELRWQKLNTSLRQVSSTMDGKYDALQAIEVNDISHLEELDVSEKMSEHLTTENAGNGEVVGEKTTVAEVQGVHLDLDPFEAHCDTYRIDDKQDGTSSISPKSDLHNMPTTSTIGHEESCCRAKVSDDDFSSSHCTDVHEAKEQDLQDKGKAASSAVEVNGEILVTNSPIQVESLRFEVSQYTGRIHLYSCIPGIDSRPKPLFKNFRPEEVSLQLPPPKEVEKTAYNNINEDMSCQYALAEFLKQWSKLSAVERRKLIGKPLQLPLCVELSYLNENLNHDNGGLLKGRSKRRTTPLDELSYPLPPNAVWRKIHLCNGKRKQEKMYTQGWSDKDEPLCKLCQTPCRNANAKTPDYFEDLFCSLNCCEEYHLRTNNRSIRNALFKIERGICTKCQLDCHKLVERIRALSIESREEYIGKVAPNLVKRKKLFQKLVQDPIDGNAWHADHIIPVYKGGGECRLENMRTLCVACHADVTATQHTERRLTRLVAKKKLKAVMSNLKTVNKPKQKVDEPEGSCHSDVEENKDEDELIVNVPGSAYSISTASHERGNSELETSASDVLDEAQHNDVLLKGQS